jgi:hypothetical protein
MPAPRGDDLTFHLAEATRMADCIRAGDWDLWNDSANASFASAYYYQAIPQLVPALLAAITDTAVLPWFQLCVFLPLVLAPAAAYRGLRVMGTPAWPALGGALAIAMAASNNRWGFGADGTFSVGLYTQTWSLAAFPLALGYGVRWVRDGAGLAPATAWSVLVTLCHPFVGFAIGAALVTGAAVVAARRLARRLGPEVAPRLRPALRAVRRVLHRGFPNFVGEEPPPPAREPLPAVRALAFRVTALGALLVVGAMSIWLPLLVDYEGFGGFPHRVADEIGPGFGALWDWLADGNLLDAAHGGVQRFAVLTALLPLVLIVARDRALPWLWSGAAVFAVLLGIGPHLPRTGDDLFPMVRFLGPFQVCLALAVGAGAVAAGVAAWRGAMRLSPNSALVAQCLIAAVGTAAVVGVTIPGARIAQWRATVSIDSPSTYRSEIGEVIAALAPEPHGRKQARRGTENHWFNLLPYVEARVPALFQMGGGGLQSSPNYDFLWNVGDPLRTAWVFDAPYLTFTREHAGSMPDGETVIETEHFMVRRLPAPGLVSAVEVAGTLPADRYAARKRAIEWLKGDAALADRMMAYAGSEGLSAPPHGRVLDVRRQPSPGDAADIVARVVADAPTTFVARESWHGTRGGGCSSTASR